MNPLRPGKAFPLGSSLCHGGANFSVFSADATAVELVLFERGESRIIPLDPEQNRTSHYWHVYVPDLRAGQRYGYRVDGPRMPESGHRFDSQKLLLDPYAKAVDASRYRRPAAIGTGNNEAAAMWSVIADPGAYDWGDDRPPEHPFSRTVIYEMHVAGFTRHPNSGVPKEKRGTFAGVIEKIPYLVDLGITAVELMPVFAFDAQDAPAGLTNYWGYSPVSFFAPHAAFSCGSDPLACLDEFRDMVKALHRVGIEVVLDVVYNHTAEGGETGPTLSFKGLDNRMYYTLSPDRSQYADFTGTGNTLNANFSIVRRMILDSLRYWVTEMHVDGFRFDLASVLSRNEQGVPIPNSPVLWDIDSDPALAGVKLMAEAWDAAGLYQVGSFIGDRWKEWNGKFRDDLRAFIKGDRGTVVNIQQRLLGSPDLFAKRRHRPEQSINFASCHDGFTLNDLVSYNQKHNEANRENNRDGSWANLSWNCGVEGPSDDPQVEALRSRQIRNLFALTLLSAGTPLLLMGDEVRRTQGGNNNAYCQDDPISWFDWNLCRKHADLLRFVRLAIRLRNHFFDSAGGQVTLAEFLEGARVDWYGTQFGPPDLSESSHSIAAIMYSADGGALNLILNAYWEPLRFTLPPSHLVGASLWRRILDTGLESPNDILEDGHPVLVEDFCFVQPRSIVLLANTSTIFAPLS